jgi:ATP-binding cassette, subfamily B (MDR/TAP), member 7
LYDPTSGTITIDDQNIESVDLTSLRENIGVVPQDTILFNGSIYNNIRYGNPEATELDVIEAAKMAELHSIIDRFPQRYETVVGERGVMMSGGEKQRVQISRLFVKVDTINKNAPIALFDEPTSALDTDTEIHLMNTIRKWVKSDKHKTAVFIAHRLSTIRDCDIIFILKDGKLYEQGTHDELVEMRGLYYNMLIAQSGS